MTSPRPLLFRRVVIIAVCLALTVAVAPAGALRLPDHAVGVPAAAARVHPDVQQALSGAAAQDPISLLVHFHDDVAFADALDVLTAAGLGIAGELPSVNVVLVHGRVAQVRALTTAPGVRFLEPDAAIPYLVDGAAWATRARLLHEDASGADLGVRAPDGLPIDGRGVGIAVIDNGIDGMHPAVEWAGYGDPDAPVVRNFKVVCSNPILNDELDLENGCFGPIVMEEMGVTAISDGHGTHVAGIAAGRDPAGSQFADRVSDGSRRYRGVAPGAELYGFAAGDAAAVITGNAAVAMQWILDNGAEQDPPIRVVNNSYGDVGEHDPEFVLNKLANALVAAGVTVVFGAGNDGEGGTTQLANNPTPGVLNVGAYNTRRGTGRDLELWSSSSRGLPEDPSTWPDLVAPGSRITAPCASVSPCEGDGTTWSPDGLRGYTYKGGTSMASPHVAGIVALLLQLQPDLTPAAIEHLLEDTAHQFGEDRTYQPDPMREAGASPTSYDAGHGLVDARAAVMDLLDLEPTEPAPAARTVFTYADEVGDAPPNLDLVEVEATELPTGDILEVSWTVAELEAYPQDRSLITVLGVEVQVPTGERRIEVQLANSNPVNDYAWEYVDITDDTVTVGFRMADLRLAAGEVITAARPYSNIGPSTDGQTPVDILLDIQASGAYVVQGPAPEASPGPA